MPTKHKPLSQPLFTMQAAPSPQPPVQAGATPRLLIEKLAFSYTHPLFLAFSARLDAPGIYGLFGRNGSGKSTLLKLLCGLLTPFAGRVEVLGHTPRERAAEFLEQIYILPEEFHLPNLTPDALRHTHASFYPRFDKDAFDTYLHELEVPPDQPFGAMSLGQKKYRQAFGPVRWVECVQAMAARGATHIVECGPGKVLSGMSKRIDDRLQALAIYDPETLAAAKAALA